MDPKIFNVLLILGDGKDQREFSLSRSFSVNTPLENHTASLGSDGSGPTENCFTSFICTCM